jgi:hypothetical protein
MQDPDLVSTLKQLHDELQRTDNLTSDAREALAALADDIQRLAASDQAPAESSSAVSQQVQDLLLGFETEHPNLTRALNQVAAALSNLGI